jgi:hypothetical protein
LEKALGQFVQSQDQNLGHLEVQIAQKARELLRQAAAAGVQQKADATPPLCPVCQKKLSRLTHGQPRTFDTQFGSVTVERTRGYCKRCRKWRVPADTALGLEDTAGYSPVVQEMSALLVSKMPVSEASVVLERLTGVKLPRATLDREARRQGQRAEQVRARLDQEATAPAPAAPKKQLELTLEPYQMIIQSTPGTSANGTIGERARRGGGRGPIPNAGTGFTRAPASGWTIAAKRPADGR